MFLAAQHICGKTGLNIEVFFVLYKRITIQEAVLATESRYSV